MTTERPPVTRAWWRCSNCHRTLGEVVGTEIRVQIGGRVLFLKADQWAAQNCPHCGLLNVRDGRPDDARRVTA